MNYVDTLIALAADCPADTGVVPRGRGKTKTVAQIQYEMLHGHPYRYTQEDVLFETWLARRDLPSRPSKAELARLRAELFSKPQACLRCSPLPKQLGWGILSNDKGQVALLAADSPEYQALVDATPPRVKVVRAMASVRSR